jgi:CRP-like cAMP-binding protein
MIGFFDYLQSVYPISKTDKEVLEEICTEQHFDKNELVQPIGHSCRTIYFVKKGALSIFYYKGEIEVTESFELENTIVARVESLFTERPSRKAIQALEQSDLIAIGVPKLFKLYDRFPELERLFRKIFEQLHVNTINRIESLQFYDADERYSNLLKERPDVLQRVPLKYIASFLGITQVSLSRIRAKKH